VVKNLCALCDTLREKSFAIYLRKTSSGSVISAVKKILAPLAFSLALPEGHRDGVGLDSFA
jgi:hypothetical protein